MPTHNIDYKKFSPGTILLSNMIKSCCEEKGIKNFDFTIGSENYKKNGQIIKVIYIAIYIIIVLRVLFVIYYLNLK